MWVYLKSHVVMSILQWTVLEPETQKGPVQDLQVPHSRNSHQNYLNSPNLAMGNSHFVADYQLLLWWTQISSFYLMTFWWQFLFPQIFFGSTVKKKGIWLNTYRTHCVSTKFSQIIIIMMMTFHSFILHSFSHFFSVKSQQLVYHFNQFNMCDT